MNSNQRDRQVWLLVFVGMMALATTTRRFRPSQAGGFTPAAERKAAPQMKLPELDGGEWRLADHRGEVVLVNYWATWCGPCREELPGLIDVDKEWAPKGLAVVGLSMDTGSDARATVQQFVTRRGVPFPIAFPDPALPGSGRMTIPTTVLLDRQGRVVKTYVGAVERKDFAKDVAALLAES